MKYSYILLEDRLKGDYKETFDAVEKYKSVNLITGEFIDERMMELIDQLLIAQENNEPVSHIVGTDIERFCKDFFSDYKIGNYLQGFFHIAERFVYLIFIWECICCINNIINKEYIFSTQTNLTEILFGYCIGMFSNVFSYFVIRPLTKVFSKVKEKTWTIINLSVALIMCIATAGISSSFSIKFPSWVVLLASGVYIIASNVCKAWHNKKLYGSIRSPEQERVRFRDLLTKPFYKKFALGWYKIFKDNNKKRAKKGKEPITAEAHLRRIAKNSDYKYRNVLLFTTLISIIVFLLILCWITGANEGQGNTGCIIFTVFIVTVAVGCGAFCIKINKYCRDVYTEFITDFNNSGLSYEDYMENMECENNA